MNTLLHKDIQHFWHPPSCSSGWMRKHAFMSIFVIGHQRIILTGVLPIRSIEKTWGWEFILLHKISGTACCFGIRTFLKQYKCYVSATIWYTDHQYLAQYREIINNLQEIPLIFCNYAVRSCGTWRKGPGQSPCNVLSISDLELYVTETSTGVCDPVTD